MSRVKKLVMFMGIIWTAALALIMSIVFLFAVVNGGTVTLVLTQFNEMHWEFVLLTFIVWPIMTLGLFYFFEQFEP